MNEEEKKVYDFHQTPPELAKKLIATLALEPTDRLYEPFMGEGAFFNNFPTDLSKDWSEITKGRDYKDYEREYDWVITNPPFRLETVNKRINAFWFLLDFFSTRAKKGIAFLANDKCFSTLTPKRLKTLEERGWCITKVVVSSVKKWRGRYFFIVLEKGKRGVFDCIEGNY